jgi:hypothetical protein
LPLVVAAGVALLAAGGAQAAIQIGETFTPATYRAGTTVLQSGSPGGQYTVPAPGMITSWSFQGGAIAPDQIRLKVARLGGMNTVTIIGQSGFEFPTANVLNSYPAQIAVQAGDVIGFYFSSSSYTSSPQPSGSGYLTLGHDGGADVQPGQPTPLAFQADVKLDISAVEALKPSNAFSFGRLKRNTHKGTATLAVRVPGPGTLSLTGRGVRTQRFGGAAAASKTASAAGIVKLLVRAKGAKKRKLNERGSVKIRVKVTYTPNGTSTGDLVGDPNTKTRRIKLIKK